MGAACACGKSKKRDEQQQNPQNHQQPQQNVNPAPIDNPLQNNIQQNPQQPSPKLGEKIQRNSNKEQQNQNIYSKQQNNLNPPEEELKSNNQKSSNQDVSQIYTEYTYFIDTYKNDPFMTIQKIIIPYKQRHIVKEEYFIKRKKFMQTMDIKLEKQADYSLIPAPKLKPMEKSYLIQKRRIWNAILQHRKIEEKNEKC